MIALAVVSMVAFVVGSVGLATCVASELADRSHAPMIADRHHVARLRRCRRPYYDWSCE